MADRTVSWVIAAWSLGILCNHLKVLDGWSHKISFKLCIHYPWVELSESNWWLIARIHVRSAVWNGYQVESSESTWWLDDLRRMLFLNNAERFSIILPNHSFEYYRMEFNNSTESFIKNVSIMNTAGLRFLAYSLLLSASRRRDDTIPDASGDCRSLGNEL